MATCRSAMIALAVFVGIGLPLCLLVATGVEYGRALKLRSEVQAAADVATVVAAKAATRGPSAMRAAVSRALAALYRPGVRHLAAATEVRTVSGAVALRIPLTVLTRVSSLYGNTAFHFTVDSFSALPPLLGRAVTRGPR